MPWKERSVVEERADFVRRLEEGESMSSLCREYSITRKTGYKIYNRYKSGGVDKLRDESRRPLTHPNRTPVEIEELIVSARQKRPTWGSKKLVHLLRKQHEGLRIPSRCTIDEILRRNGLVTPRRRRKLIPTYPEDLAKSQAPNDIWCADFKGQFRLGNGKLCYPLTITDHFSRYLLACVALERPTAAAAFVVFNEVFSRYGLPRTLRTDNGVPFAGLGIGGLSQLSAWWISLGIVPERIDPGHPEQNGRHERMHRDLKAETTRPPAQTILGQQEKIDIFMPDFNQVRPHEAIGFKVPSGVYCPSDVTYPRELDSIRYPLHDQVCRVAPNGIIRVAKVIPKWIFLGRAFASHFVGLRELPDRRWLVTFAKLDLGHISPDGLRFEPLEKLVQVRQERQTRPNHHLVENQPTDPEAAPPKI